MCNRAVFSVCVFLSLNYTVGKLIQNLMLQLQFEQCFVMIMYMLFRVQLLTKVKVTGFPSLPIKSFLTTKWCCDNLMRIAVNVHGRKIQCRFSNSVSSHEIVLMQKKKKKCTQRLSIVVSCTLATVLAQNIDMS